MSQLLCPSCQFPNVRPDGDSALEFACAMCGTKFPNTNGEPPATVALPLDDAEAPTIALPPVARVEDTTPPLPLPLVETRELPEADAEAPTISLPPTTAGIEATKTETHADTDTHSDLSRKSRRPPREEEREDNAENAPRAKSARRWYYESDDRAVGPVTEKELQAAAKKNKVTAESRVWADGMDDWQPAFEALPRLFEEPEGESFWGVQRTVAVVLATFAVGSLAGLALAYTHRPVPKAEVVQAEKKKEQSNSTTAVKPEKEPEVKKEPDSGITQPKIDPAAKSGVAELATRAKAGKPDDRLKAVKDLEALGTEAKPAVPVLIGLLDDSDDRVRRAAAGALEAIGTPAREDLGAVEKALAGKPPLAKRYALHYYATVQKAAYAQLPLIVAALDDSEAETQEEALRAISFYGPDSKPVTLRKLFDKLLDPKPAVSKLAARVLDSFTPFEGDDRVVLVENLKSPEPTFRYLSVRLLTPLADDTTALKWFLPLVTDLEPEIRERAIAALALRGVAAKSAVPAFLDRTKDENVSVRVAAIRALGDVGGGPDVAPALAKFLDPKAENDPRIRPVAVRALLRIQLNTPATDVPALGLLLGEPEASVRAAALTKLAAFGTDAAPLLPQVGKLLSEADADVRLAALKVVAAVGPKAADLAPKVAELITKKFDGTGAPQPLSGGDGEEIAARLTRSAVWISVHGRSGRQVWIGSGVLVDRKARLILTNYHVGTPGYDFVVFFPYRRGDKLETSPAYYLENAATLSRTGHAQVGRVVAADASCDLSVIQLDGAPPTEARAIPLAAEPAKPGQALHTVGCSGAGAGTLWRYTDGKARQIYDNEVRLDGVQRVKCKMLETSMAINSGDSGSAVANDKGELVGINFATAVNKTLVSYAVDLSVVKAAADIGAGRVGLRPTPGVSQPELIAAGPADSVQKLALDALAKMGGPGTAELANLLDKKVPREIREGVCDRLGEIGAEISPAAISQLLLAAVEDSALRPRIADALTKCGGDRVSAALQSRIDWYVVSRVRKSKANYPVDYHLWILGVISEIRVKTLSEDGKKTLLKFLKDRALPDPNKECKAAALKALQKLEPLLTTPKK